MVTIRLTNSKTRRKEDFQPIDPSNVRMYVCGPTVYDRAHLGNARPVVVFDVLNRLLRHVYGTDHVTYVRNFTDVDDKINAEALRRQKAGSPGTLEDLIHQRTEETIAWYHADMDALGALRPAIRDDRSPEGLRMAEPRATEYIGQMVAMISGLIASGHAYEANSHVLFRVRSYAGYGKLSGRSIDDMIAGARVEVAPFKEDPMDFVLWKPSSGEEPGWASPWGPNDGRGRPGWHIECSAMAHELLGESFDIHGGGLDLQFPHHENEIAQSACAHPHGQFARYWLHNEMLQVEGKKMSKSLGNFFTVRDLLDQGVPGEVIRFVFLMTHYRKPMDWTVREVTEARQTLVDWRTLTIACRGNGRPDENVVNSLKNDLNTYAALSNVRNLAQRGDAEALLASARLLGLLEPNLGGWFSFGTESSIEEPEVLELFSIRNSLRLKKQFALADQIRKQMSLVGYRIIDHKDRSALTRSSDQLAQERGSEIWRIFKEEGLEAAQKFAEESAKFGMKIHVDEDGPSAWTMIPVAGWEYVANEYLLQVLEGARVECQRPQSLTNS